MKKLDYEIKKLKIDNKKLLEENRQLKIQNDLFKTFNGITVEDKIKVLEDYFNWCAKEDVNEYQLTSFYKYKQKLKGGYNGRY